MIFAWNREIFPADSDASVPGKFLTSAGRIVQMVLHRPVTDAPDRRDLGGHGPMREVRLGHGSSGIRPLIRDLIRLRQQPRFPRLQRRDLLPHVRQLRHQNIQPRDRPLIRSERSGGVFHALILAGASDITFDTINIRACTKWKLMSASAPRS